MKLITIAPKTLNIILVTCMALCLSGCANSNASQKSACVKKSASTKKKPCKTTRPEAAKIISPDPLTIPYKTVGNPNRGPTMAAIKESLRNANGSNIQQGAIGALRAQSLRETALSLGARGGLAERAQHINYTLLNYEPILAKIFQFYGLMLDDNILPPVLVEARNTLNLSGGDAIRIADSNYKIIAQARFVTVPPAWRDYIWMSYDTPELPDRSLLPKNKPERIMWERDIDEGWQAGLKQADVIFVENMNRLVRDYNGMVMYRKLLAQNMVSPPFVAKMGMGITGNSEDMTINDRILRITAFPQLQTSGENWKTEIHRYE